MLQVDPAEECPLLAAAPSKVISSLPFEVKDTSSHSARRSASCRLGCDCQAILLRSRDAEVAKKAPLVVFPHGTYSLQLCA